MVGWMPGFFDIEERLRELSAKGDDLECIKGLVDFGKFRADLEAAVPRADRSRGGRPPFDHVLMFKVLILQTMHALSDERCECLIKDRLSFMRFLGLGLADPVPDANTIWTFREALKKAKVIDALFLRFDEALRASGYLAMGGQIVDATIIAAPKQRNTADEKKAIKEGRIPQDWKDKPAKLRQKDRDALDGQIQQGQAKGGRRASGRSGHSGIRLQEPCLDRSSAWPDPPMDGDRCGSLRWRAPGRCAGQGEHRERGLGGHGLSIGEERGDAGQTRLRIAHPSQEAEGPAAAGRIRIANARKSKVRSAVEHVFAHQGQMGLIIRTIGLARARVKIGLANLAYRLRERQKRLNTCEIRAKTP